jgi:hypothetical protein
MARRKAASVTRTKSGDSVVVVAPPTAPVRRSSGRRRAAAPKKRRRSSAGGGGGGASYKNRMIGTGIGGAVYGFLEKQFPNMPQIPLVGKSGTVAIACYMFGAKHELIRDVGIAAAAIAGYTLGGTGQVSGYFGDDHGLASQT